MKTQKRATQKSNRKSISLPKLGKNEIQRGIAFSDKGKPLYHLIEILGDHGSANHARALEIAKEKGGKLANPAEGRLLAAVDKPGAGSGWFWLEPQYEGGADYAWAQYFGYGSQLNYHEDDEFRVRLVRMILI